MVWEAAVSSQKYSTITTPIDPQFQPTGFFRFDFLNACKLLGVIPHPGVLRGLVLTPAVPAESVTPAKAAPPKKGAPVPLEVPESERMTCSELHIRGFEVDSATAHALFLAVPMCTTLQSIRFYHIQITPQALQKICEGIAKNVAVNSLYVDDCSLTPEHFDAIKPSLKMIKSLSVRHTEMSDTLAVKLFETIKGVDLHMLALWGSTIGDSVAKPLADYLSASKSLQLLSLGYTHLTDTGVSLLTETLGRKPLDAAQTTAAKKQIEEQKRKKGAEPLPYEDVAGVLYLAGNRSLQHLNLSHTSVTDASVSKLAAVLAVNNSLTNIVLDDTTVVQENTPAFQEVQRLLEGRVKK